MESGVVLAVRPRTNNHEAYILLTNNDAVTEIPLLHNSSLSIQIQHPGIRHCVGWYDITTHTNHACEQYATVDAKFDTCFSCRKKTDFNPAFYNASEVSEKQQAYNMTPHTVYIAYFGGGLAKAGIMADSRGLDRLYEQGALWYVIVKHCDDAIIAHQLEERLIAKGLKNSVTKKQKELVFARQIDAVAEENQFRKILQNLSQDGSGIVALLNHFFFGKYPGEIITPRNVRPISGKIIGIVGRYLVLENNDRLYGIWLNDLLGYEVIITDGAASVVPIDASPIQVPLF